MAVSRRLAEGFVEIIVTDRSLSIAPKTRSGCWSGSSVSIRRVVCLPVAPGLPAIGKHLVANLGGKVQLWSGPGTGATFVLRLPRIRTAHNTRHVSHRRLSVGASLGSRADRRGRDPR